MLVSKFKAWSTCIFGRHFILTGIALLIGFVFPMSILGYAIFDAGGDIKATFFNLSEANSSSVGKHSSLAAICAVVAILAPAFALIMLIQKMLGKRIRVGIFRATEVIHLNAKSSGENELLGKILVRGKQGAAKLQGPYVEVFIGDNYVAGLMGNEGVELTLPEGKHMVKLRLASFADPKQAATASAFSNDTPLRFPITERKMKKRKLHSMEFPVTVKSGSVRKFFFRIGYAFRYPEVINKSDSKGKKSFGLKITAWAGN